MTAPRQNTSVSTALVASESITRLPRRTPAGDAVPGPADMTSPSGASSSQPIARIDVASRLDRSSHDQVADRQHFVDPAQHREEHDRDERERQPHDEHEQRARHDRTGVLRGGGQRVAGITHGSADDLAEDTGHRPGDVQNSSCCGSRLVLSHLKRRYARTARGTSGVPCRSAWAILRFSDRSPPVHQAAGETRRSQSASSIGTTAKQRSVITHVAQALPVDGPSCRAPANTRYEHDAGAQPPPGRRSLRTSCGRLFRTGTVARSHADPGVSRGPRPQFTA